MRRLVMVVVWLVLGVHGAVNAHASLAHSEPSANARLARSPSEIRLWFTEPLDPTFSRFTLRSADGQTVSIGPVVVDPDEKYQMAAEVGELTDGLYTVLWRSLSTADGHASEGSFAFTVGSAALVTPANAIQAEAVATDSVVIRAINFVSISLLAGGLAFWIWVWPSAGLPVFAPAKSRVMRQIAIGWLLVGVATILMLLLQTSVAADMSLFDVATTEAPALVLTQTRFGALLSTRLLLWLVVGVCLLRAGYNRRWLWLALAVTAVLMLTHSAFGHAAAAEAASAAIAGTWLHLLAASLWAGGLVQFVLVLAALHYSEVNRTQVASRLVAAFSNYARVCVIALIFSGVYAGWLHVGSFVALTGTLYGKTLIVKIALFLPLLLLALINLVITTRRLQDGRTVWFGRLRGFVGAEAVLTGLILLATGALTSASPARSVQAMRDVTPILPEPMPYYGMAIAPEFMAHLDITPGWVGENEFRVSLYAPNGSMINDATLIRLRFENRTEMTAQSELRPELGESSYYIARGANLSLPGVWRIRMTVQRPGAFDTIMDFEPSIGFAPAATLPTVDLAIPVMERAVAAGLVGAALAAAGGYFLVVSRPHWRSGGAWVSLAVISASCMFLIAAVNAAADLSR